MMLVQAGLSFVTPVMKVCAGQRNKFIFLMHVKKSLELPLNYFSSRELSLPDQTVRQDFLLQNIRSATHSSGILEIIANHHSIMNNVHVIQALKSLFQLQKSEQTSMNKHDILNSPEFEKLCKRLKRQARTIELDDTVDALKFVSYIGVPSTTNIFQVLLNLVKHNVNELSLAQIVFLDFVLEKSAKSSLGSVLKMALPLVFEVQLKTKFDHDANCVHVANMLKYAIKNKLSSLSVEFLLEHIRRNINNLDTKAAKHITWSLTTLKPSQFIQDLLPRTLEIMSSDMNDIPSGELGVILSKLSSRYSQTHPYYYSEKFCDSCATYVVKNNCDLDFGARILRKLSRIGHINIRLLEYLGEQIVNCPEEFISRRPHIVIALVSGLSIANYKPANWSYIENVILKHNALKEFTMTLPWVKFAVDLAVLKCFPTFLIERIFEEAFLEEFLSREYNFLDHIQLLLLYQAVVTLMPDYSGPFPPEDILEKAVAFNGMNVENFPLQGALEQGLGGSSYVRTKVYTKLGHFVAHCSAATYQGMESTSCWHRSAGMVAHTSCNGDHNCAAVDGAGFTDHHAIVIRKGGFPVSINCDVTSSRIYIEDFDVPVDCKIILIQCFRPSCYAVNYNRLKGYFVLMQRSLEGLGYGVLPISISDWIALPDHEKIPYVMQTIMLKYDTYKMN